MDVVKMSIWTALGIPDPTPEYRFDSKRRWRIDYAWPDVRLAVEIEGGAWTRGRHTRGKGFLGDIEKYNALASSGWTLLRYTPAVIRYDQVVGVYKRLKENRMPEGLDAAVMGEEDNQ